MPDSKFQTNFRFNDYELGPKTNTILIDRPKYINFPAGDQINRTMLKIINYIFIMLYMKPQG